MTYTVVDNREGTKAPFGHRIGPNLAPNPSFEDGTTMPTGWAPGPNTTGIYHWDTTTAHSGLKSIGALNLTTNEWEAINWQSEFIPADYLNHSYMLSGWFKITGTPEEGQYAFFHLAEYDENYQLNGGGGFGYGHAPNWTKSINETTSMNPWVKYVKIVLGQGTWSTTAPNPSVEARFDDIYFGEWNTVPDTPTITGKTQGKIDTLYTFTFTTNDPENDNVTYEIDWGDNTSQVTGSYASGEGARISHIWGIKGTYIIQARATDQYGAQSTWGILTVTLPCSSNLPMGSFWASLFERFPHAFPILRQLLGY
jgi:hypothetical protein